MGCIFMYHGSVKKLLQENLARLIRVISRDDWQVF